MFATLRSYLLNRKSDSGPPTYTPIWLWEEDWLVGDAKAKFRMRLLSGYTETVTLDFNDGAGPYTLSASNTTAEALWSADGSYAVELVTDAPDGFFDLDYIRKYNSNVPDRCDISGALYHFPGEFISISDVSFRGAFPQMIKTASNFFNIVRHTLLDDEDIDINEVVVTATGFVQVNFTADSGSSVRYTEDLSTWVPKLQGAGLTTIVIADQNNMSWDSVVATVPQPSVSITISSCGLSAASVDNALLSCDASSLASCTITLSGNGGRTSASDTAVSNLVGRGWVINV